MISYEIPDPFEEFVINKYKNFKGMTYDFFGREWHGSCLACNDELYAPSKKEYIKNRLYHTRNLCLGGY
jgi:GH18 family chitinase